MERKRTLIAVMVSAVLALVALTGCAGAIGDSKPASQAVGSFSLRVNPQIMMTYDQSGRVLSLEGSNDEGARLAAAYDDYIGKTSSKTSTRAATS